MHEDLQALPQSPQLLHFSVLITGAKMLNLERNPNVVPTGQTVLHHVLPFVHASMNMMMNVAAAIMRTGIDLIQISTS
jgi:hypothetical protein